MRRRRAPGFAVGSMKMSAKRYVPLSLTRTRAALIPCPTASTRAPPRFFPRINTRTGLMEWPAHQFGGSTFSTDGACAAQTADETNRNANNRRGRADDNEWPCLLRVMPSFLIFSASAPSLLELVALGGVLRAFAHDGVATVKLGEAAQARGQFFVERALAEAPGPVATHRGGGVHARLGREAEHVLQGHERGVADRSADGADEVPVDFAPARVEVGEAELALALDLLGASDGRAAAGLTLEPADGGIVVVRARVDDRVADVVVRQVFVGRVGAEAELDDAHARKVELVAQRDHVGRDEAEVFGDDGERAEFRLDGLKEFAARREDPLAALGGLVAARNLPVGREAAEVVNADDVNEREHGARARDPPLEAVLAHPLPIVDGVAPELARAAEVVGRDSGDEARAATLVELEEVGLGPHVSRVVRDEDGDVADDLNLLVAAVGAQARPLVEEEELFELDALGLFGEAGGGP